MDHLLKHEATLDERPHLRPSLLSTFRGCLKQHTWLPSDHVRTVEKQSKKLNRKGREGHH